MTESGAPTPAIESAGQAADSTLPAGVGRESRAGAHGGSPTGAGDAPVEVASYEQARDELASVVSRLESGGLTLDESLTLWERGEHLAAVCATFLDGARERVDTALASTQNAD